MHRLIYNRVYIDNDTILVYWYSRNFHHIGLSPLHIHRYRDNPVVDIHELAIVSSNHQHDGHRNRLDMDHNGNQALNSHIPLADRMADLNHTKNRIKLCSKPKAEVEICASIYETNIK